LRIIVDAMGGDNAPQEIVNGCILAIKEREDIEILLVGDSNKIKTILKERNFDSQRLIIKHAGEVISNEDSPTKAIKGKKDSSMVVGFNALKSGEGQVFVSAGNTGALLTGALLILGRIKGVDRPALAPLIPTQKGGMLIIDGGANTICKPVNFLQFGIMGSIYMRDVFEVDNPKVGLINVGSEKTKGNDLLKNAHKVLSNSNINFVGNTEGQQLLEGSINVAVCDGFVGNVILKFLEGASPFFFKEMKLVFTRNIFSKIAAIVLKKGLKNFKNKLDPSEYGAAPFLGVNGKVLKSHGRADSKAIKNAVLKAYNFAKSSINEQLEEKFKNMEVEEIE